MTSSTFFFLVLLKIEFRLTFAIEETLLIGLLVGDPIDFDIFRSLSLDSSEQLLLLRSLFSEQFDCDVGFSLLGVVLGVLTFSMVCKHSKQNVCKQSNTLESLKIFKQMPHLNLSNSGRSSRVGLPLCKFGSNDCVIGIGGSEDSVDSCCET